MILKPAAALDERLHLLRLYLDFYLVDQQFLPKAVKHYQDLRLCLNPQLIIHD